MTDTSDEIVISASLTDDVTSKAKNVTLELNKLQSMAKEIQQSFSQLGKGLRVELDGIGVSIRSSLAPLRDLKTLLSTASFDAEATIARAASGRKETASADIKRVTADLQVEIDALNAKKKSYAEAVEGINALRAKLSDVRTQAAGVSNRIAEIETSPVLTTATGRVSKSKDANELRKERADLLVEYDRLKKVQSETTAGIRGGVAGGAEADLSGVIAQLKSVNAQYNERVSNLSKILSLEDQIASAEAKVARAPTGVSQLRAQSQLADKRAQLAQLTGGPDTDGLQADAAASAEALKSFQEATNNARQARVAARLQAQADREKAKSDAVAAKSYFKELDTTSQMDTADKTAQAQKQAKLSAVGVDLNQFLAKQAAAEEAAAAKTTIQGVKFQIGQVTKERIQANKDAAAEVTAEEKKTSSLNAATMRIYRAEAARKQKEEEAAQRKVASEVATPKPAASFDDIWTKRNENLFGDGGFQFLALQGRIMLGYQALNAVVGGITGSLSSVVELQDAMKSLQAITSTSYADMDELKKVILETGAATKFTAVDIAKAATVLGQAGLSSREIINVLPAITSLASAMGGDLNGAVDVATSAMGAFNLQAMEMTHVSNIMTAALNESKLDITKLALGLQYAGNVAGESGITFTEFNAILATMADKGIKSGSTLGTGIRELVNEFTAPTAKLINYLQMIGLTQDDISIKSHGFIGVMKNLTEAGFTANDAMKSLSVRGGNAFAALSKGIDGIDAQIIRFNESSAAVEANAIQMESLKATWISFQNVLTAVTDNALTGPMLALQKVLVSIRDGLKTINDNAGGMIRVLGDVGLGAIVVLTGRWALSLLKVKEVFTELVAILRVLPAVLAGTATFLTPFGWVGTLGTLLATAAASFLIYKSEINSALEGLNKEFDKNKSKIDEVKGAYDTYRARLDSVSSTTESLYAKQDRLTKNSGELQAAVSEARSRFGDLNAELYTNIDTFDKLISVLNKVKGTIDEFSKSKLTEVKVSLKDQLDTIEKQIAESKVIDLAKLKAPYSSGSSTYTQAPNLNLTQESRTADSIIQSEHLPADAGEAKTIQESVHRSLTDFNAQLLHPTGDNIELIEFYKSVMIPALNAYLVKISGAATVFAGQASADRGIASADYGARFRNYAPSEGGGTSKNPLVNRVAGELGYDWMGSAFDAIIGQESSGHHIDPKTGKINTSSAGALGIMQMMPKTFEEVVRKNRSSFGVNPDINNEEDNLRAGILEFMKLLTNPQNGGVENALIGYNAGPGYLTNGKALPKETLDYIKKLKGPVIAAVQAQLDKNIGNDKVRYEQLRKDVDATNKQIDESTKDGGNPVKTNELLNKLQKQVVEAKALEEIFKQDAKKNGGEETAINDFVGVGNAGLVKLAEDRKANKANLVKLYNDMIKEQQDQIKALDKKSSAADTAELLKSIEDEKLHHLDTIVNIEKKKAEAEHAGSDFNVEAAVKEAVERAVAERESIRSLFDKNTDAIKKMGENRRKDALDSLVKNFEDTKKEAAAEQKNREDSSAFNSAQRASSALQGASGYYKGNESIFSALGQTQSVKAASSRAGSLQARSAENSKLIEDFSGQLPQMKAAATLANQLRDAAAAEAKSLQESHASKELQVAAEERLKSLRSEAAKADSDEKAIEAEITSLKQNQAAIDEEQKAAAIIKRDNLGELLGLQLNDQQEQLGQGASLNASLAEGFGAAMTTMRGSMGQFFTDWETGTKTAGDAFKGFVSGILQSMLKVVNDAIAKQFMSMIVNAAGGSDGFLGSIFGAAVGAATGGGPSSSGGAGGGSSGGNADGGRVTAGWNGPMPRFATGGPVSGGEQNKDSVPIVTMPGEWVINQKAVKSVGNDFMKSLNDNGAAALNNARPVMNLNQVNQNSTNNGHVNVWVVSPDQTPPPGPKDIIATVAQNISQNGQIKQMIQSVAMGRV